MVAFARRSFSGSAPDSFLTSPMDGVTLTATCSNLTGWPDGSGGNFVVIFDPGTVNEEKCLASARTGNVLTLVARAYEESAVAHASTTCVVRHGYSAHDADEANNAVSQTIGAVAAKGDLLVGSAANTLTKVSVGSAGQALVVAGGTWVPGTPALPSFAGSLGADVSGITTATTLLTTPSLAVGTWMVSWAIGASVLTTPQTFRGGILVGTATATFSGVQSLNGAIETQNAGAISGVVLVSVTVAGTLILQTSPFGGTMTATHLTGISSGTVTGYTAVKIA